MEKLVVHSFTCLHLEFLTRFRDLDTTDVEVYGRKKDGVEYSHQGQRVGRPHVASWAGTETVLAADLGSGLDDPRATADKLLARALASLPHRIRREQVRLRTLHPDQRALPLEEFSATDAIYAYSFVLTNLDLSTPGDVAVVDHWYRHRTSVENIFRDTKHGAALRHLPSGNQRVNTAWMWGALLAANIAAWCHQLTGVLTDDHTGIVAGHGVRGGKAMIATLRDRLIAIPARLIRHGRTFTLRPAPGYRDLPLMVLDRLRALPAP
jgi:hypothetical protein